MRCDICDKEYVGRPAYILHEGKMVWACPRCAKKYGQIKPWEKKEEPTIQVSQPTAVEQPPVAQPMGVEPPATPVKPPEVAPIPTRTFEEKVLEEKGKPEVGLGISQEVCAALLEELRKMNQKLDTLIELVNEL